jgi:hypothetical protein
LVGKLEVVSGSVSVFAVPFAELFQSIRRLLKSVLEVPRKPTW